MANNSGQYEMKKDSKDQWYWIFYAGNGKAITRSSESYINKKDCEASAKIMQNTKDALIISVEG